MIACINGEHFVKRLEKEGETWVLKSESPKYPPRYIMEADELRIWGVVGNSVRRHLCHG